MERESFVSEFVREYLRYLQRKHSTVTGLFYLDGKPFIWGTLVHYGEPPFGGLLVEMGPQDEPNNNATYRFWHAAPNENGDYRRKKPVMFGEIKD